MEAARVAAGMLDGDGDGDAAASIGQIYADYRNRLAAMYTLERR